MTAVEPDSEAKAPAESVAVRLRDAHLGTVLAALSLLFVTLKVLMVSHFEITTALAVISESDTASLLIGALVRSLGSVMLAALVLLAVAFRSAEADGAPSADRSFYRVVGWAVGVVATVIQPVLLAPLVLMMAWLSFGGPGHKRVFDRALARNHKKREAESAREAAEIEQRVADAQEEADALRRAMAAGRPEMEGLMEAMERSDSLSREEALQLAERSIAIVTEESARAAAVHSKILAVRDSGEAFLLRREARIEQFRTSLSKLQRLNWTFVAAMVVLSISPFSGGLLSDRPWLPAERIVANGRPAITGYVLKTEGEGMVVLQDRPRRVVRLGVAPTSREFCWVRSSGSRLNWWVGALLSKPTTYPLCSDLHP